MRPTPIAARIVGALVGCAFSGGLLGGPPAALGSPSSVHRGDEVRWLASGWADYAPSGVPDFSQCRPEWGRPGEPGRPGQWTYAGPVALADTFWWLDSVFEPMPRPPAEVHDAFPLVTAYPRFGPAVDDHDVRTMVQLVEDLALRAHTDARGTQRQERGTRWEDLVQAAAGYVNAHGLAADFSLETVAPPDLSILRPALEAGSGVVLLLGVWERQDNTPPRSESRRGPRQDNTPPRSESRRGPGQEDERWYRIGGHYAGLAGWSPAVQGDLPWGAIALSDPLADSAANNGSGRRTPEDPTRHSCRNQPRAHDDAAIVSHDLYRLVDSPALPGGRLVLADYFTAGNEGEGAAFAGQNAAEFLKDAARPWKEGVLAMAIDAALVVRPLRGAPVTPPRGTPAATPMSTSTVEANATPTAGAIPSATEVPPSPTDAHPTPTEPASPTPAPPTPPGPSTRTPSPHASPSPPPSPSPTSTPAGEGPTATIWLPAAILFNREPEFSTSSASTSSPGGSLAIRDRFCDIMSTCKGPPGPQPARARSIR